MNPVEEIDASMVFKQAPSDLRNTRNLSDALSAFGYSRDDKMEQRELVNIYRSVERELEAEISRNARNGHYDAAKDIRARLTAIRAEFDDLQLSAVRREKELQQKLFAQASMEYKKATTEVVIRSNETVEETCQRLKADLRLSHAIQMDNLLHKLSLIPKPQMKYSKRANDYMNAEKELIRLCQYDDAKKTRLKVEQIKPKEEREFEKSLVEKRQKIIDDLRKQQQIDEIRLDEKLKGMRWNGIRREEHAKKLSDLRIETNYKEMAHAQVLQDRIKPEMSVKPSALWEKRKNFQNTSALLRGQQFLDVIHGKKKGEQVYAESLVTRHDFSRYLDGTINLDYES